jgi:cation-transporting ATPase E
LFTLFNALVIPAAVALFLLGDYRGAWAVSAMAGFNTLIALAQELRAKRHLDRLALLAESSVRAVRDGAECRIPAGDVVRGDLLRIAAGEPVVADGPVLNANFLEVDEALLTGESDPVRRNPGDPLLSGSFVIAGDGSYRADRVGTAAYAHQTAAEARKYHYAPGPVQRTLDSLIRLLTAVTLVFCGLYVVLYWFRGLTTTELVQMVAATVTSLVPQGLVLMTTVALTLGAVRLTSRGAVVQRLAAVEAMASIDVVCTDKTGTLTTNHFAVDSIDTAEGERTSVLDRLQTFARASLDDGNRTILAIRSFFAANEHPITVTDRIPFKSQNRFSAVRVRTDGGERTFVLGSLDALRPRFAGEDVAWIDRRFAELLPSGLRLVAFGEGHTSDLLHGPLRPLALVALRDELRPDAAEVIASLSAQGVRFLILSGDHPETVRAAISGLNLPMKAGSVRTGTELENAADRPRMIADASVFGRVTPTQKVEIVTTLQKQGHRVAMIGDGVNDILAVKSADLGIAMGAGSSATKTVAGLVLETNRFALLPDALAEGRTVIHNVRRAAKLFLLKNVYTLFLIPFLVGILREAFPYLPQQVTLLNALTIGGPVVLIMLSTAPPNAAVRSAFLPEVGRFVFGMGLPIGVAGLAIWLHAERFGTDGQRTMLLSTLILAGLATVVLVGGTDRRLAGWAVAAVLAYLTAVSFEPIRHFFVMTPLTRTQWASVASAAAVGVIVGWLVTGILNRLFHSTRSHYPR